MARHTFGGDSASFVVNVAVNKAVTAANGVVVTFSTAATGGSAVTDLLAADGTTPVTSITTNSDGTLPLFYGPSGTTQVWAIVPGAAERLLVGHNDLAATYAPITGGAAYVARGPVASADASGATDLANLTAAIAALPSTGGVLILSGLYQVSGPVTLPNGVTLFALDPGAGYLQSTPASFSGATIKAVGGATFDVIRDTPVSGSTDAKIIGVNVQGSATATPVHFVNAQRAVVKNAHLVYAPGPVLKVDAGLGATFEDILATGGMITLPGAISGNVDISGTDHFLTRIESGAGLGALSAGTQYVAGIALRGSNCTVTACIGELSDIGWQVIGDYNKFAVCRGDTNWAGDWNISGSANQFAACAGMNSGKAAANTYDAWTTPGQGNVLTGCTVAQQAAATYRYGFNDTGTYASTLSRNVFSGCHGSGYATDLTKVNNGFGAIAFSVPSSAITPPNGATTWDVTQASIVALYNYSAPATVTAFTHGVDGQELTVHAWDANVTLQHTALGGATNSIILTGGANLTLAAGKAYRFRRWGGVWWQT